MTASAGQGLRRPAGKPDRAWAPTISAVPDKLKRGKTYTATGTQFNGLSQAAGFGDEYETNTNYPLVRITNQATGHVFFARTHDHSSMGVATGSTPVSTHFDVPAGAETGASTLEVVANGIASKKFKVKISRRGRAIPRRQLPGAEAADAAEAAGAEGRRRT